MIDTLRNYSTEASRRTSPYRHAGTPARSGSIDQGITLIDCMTWNSSESSWCLEAAPLVDRLMLTPATWDVRGCAKGTFIKEFSRGFSWPDIDTSQLAIFGSFFPEQILSKGSAARAISTGWVATLDSIIVELGRLTPGWDGDDSILPSQSLLRDIETALRVLPSKTAEPNIDVDSSDGSVGLTWDMDDGRHVAASFSGNGRIFLFVGCPQAGNWSASALASDDVRILELFDRAFNKADQPA